MVAELPDFGRQEAIRVSCIGLGWEVDPEEASKTSNPASELLCLPVLDDLRARLNFIVLKIKLQERMLLPVFCLRRNWNLPLFGLAST